jgi:GTP-dependent phosphoenolpyruvate carboxykinase
VSSVKKWLKLLAVCVSFGISLWVCFKEALKKKEVYTGYCSMAGELKFWKRDEETKFLKCVHSPSLFNKPSKTSIGLLKMALKRIKGFRDLRKRARINHFVTPKGFSLKATLCTYLRLAGASSKKVERS